MNAARALLAVLALALGACVNVTPPGIQVSSTPPGARVLIDGEDSGFVTPANIALTQNDHWLELRMEGYASTALFLREGSHLTVIPWSEGIVNPITWPFPVFLPAADLLLPFRVNESPLPSRVHVDLRLAAEG